MRAMLLLLVVLLPAPTLAARGDPLICDPPPSTSPDCAEGQLKLRYFDPLVFSDEQPDITTMDFCATSTTSPSWVRVCEADKKAARVQMLCKEDADHAVTCEASPRSANDLIYLWEAKDRFITTDAQTD